MENLHQNHFRVRFGALVLAGLALAAAAQSVKKSWNFDGDAAGKPPAGFTFARTGQGSEGKWEIKNDDSAPSKSNVLAQTSADKTDYRFPLALAEGTNFKDFSLSVKFKTLSGKVDQGAGLVFRAQDSNNYYVVRANALENNYRLYHVVGGRRVQFAAANFKVTPQAWHEMKVEARGEEFRCFYDGELKITARDAAFKDGGKIGLWTKADSVIYFDDLTVQELAAARSAAPSAKTPAQQLVNDLAKKHPEVVRIGLHVTPPGGAVNLIVASNVAAKIGQKSDPEDLQAMKTGRPLVLKEGENFDVTLPLHDANGKMIGAIGLTLKPRAGETEAAATRRAQSIASEFEKQIPSKESLFRS